MARLSQIRKTAAYYLTEPVVRLLDKTSISPNTITWFGFLLAIGAAGLIVTGHLFAAGFMVLLAGFLDILDGALARYHSQVTRFGAVLDSILDRLSEAGLLLAILVFFILTQQPSFFIVIDRAWLTLLVCLALLGSLLVSYIRARAEALGMECQVGIFTRAERVIVLALGLLLNQIVIALAIIVVLSFFTAGQRLIFVWQQTKIR